MAVGSADPVELPLDGSTKSGTLNQNEYDYYIVRSPQSGNVHITTTVTQNPIGVWTWVGRAYEPIDGNSDWDMVRACVRAYKRARTLRHRWE